MFPGFHILDRAHTGATRWNLACRRVSLSVLATSNTPAKPSIALFWKNGFLMTTINTVIRLYFRTYIAVPPIEIHPSSPKWHARNPLQLKRTEPLHQPLYPVLAIQPGLTQPSLGQSSQKLSENRPFTRWSLPARGVTREWTWTRLRAFLTQAVLLWPCSLTCC